MKPLNERRPQDSDSVAIEVIGELKRENQKLKRAVEAMLRYAGEDAPIRGEVNKILSE